MKLPRPGLRGKLALSIALVLLLALGVAFVAVYRGTGSELESRTDADLEREVERLTLLLAGSGAEDSGEYTEVARALTSSETFGPNARVVAVTVAGGGGATNQPGLFGPDDRFRSPGYEGDDDREPEEKEDREDHRHEREEHRDDAEQVLEAKPGYTTVDLHDAGDVRLLTRRVDLPGGVWATIQVGQPTAPVDNALEDLGNTFAIVGILTLLIGALAGWLLANSATRPMRRMAIVAEEVDEGDLSTRMPVAGTRDEARRLAESFNGMLERLEAAFERQKKFVADASHDLRTPITVVRGQIEVLARNPDPSAEEVRRVSGIVSQATSRMEAMVDDLLLLARSENDESQRLETLDLEPLIQAEVEARASGNRKIEIGGITGSPVDIDREQISRALSNLVSNAVNHTSERGRIEVSALDRGSSVVIAVDDDGPGVPASERSRIFDRFARLDQARTSSEGGSGLGLAIVKAIAESHGGSARCVDSSLGGARFEIELPVSGQAS